MQVIPYRLNDPKLASRFRNAVTSGVSRRPSYDAVSGDSYEVYGNSDTYETRFFISDGEVWATCTCGAGQNGNPCYHVGYLSYVRGLSLATSGSYRPARIRGRAVTPAPTRDIVLELKRGQSFELDFDAKVRISPK